MTFNNLWKESEKPNELKKEYFLGFLKVFFQNYSAILKPKSATQMNTCLSGPDAVMQPWFSASLNPKIEYECVKRAIQIQILPCTGTGTYLCWSVV